MKEFPDLLSISDEFDRIVGKRQDSTEALLNEAERMIEDTSTNLARMRRSVDDSKAQGHLSSVSSLVQVEGDWQRREEELAVHELTVWGRINEGSEELLISKKLSTQELIYGTEDLVYLAKGSTKITRMNVRMDRAVIFKNHRGERYTDVPLLLGAEHRGYKGDSFTFQFPKPIVTW